MSQEEIPPPVARARLLAAAIAAASNETERARRIPEPLLARLHAARFFRMLLPRSFGGDETQPGQYLAAIEEIAREDASVAWKEHRPSDARSVHRLGPEEGAARPCPPGRQWGRTGRGGARGSKPWSGTSLSARDARVDLRGRRCRGADRRGEAGARAARRNPMRSTAPSPSPPIGWPASMRSFPAAHSSGAFATCTRSPSKFRRAARILRRSGSFCSACRRNRSYNASAPAPPQASFSNRAPNR